jgi:hypothetical protein
MIKSPQDWVTRGIPFNRRRHLYLCHQHAYSHKNWALRVKRSWHRGRPPIHRSIIVKVYQIHWFSSNLRQAMSFSSKYLRNVISAINTLFLLCDICIHSGNIQPKEGYSAYGPFRPRSVSLEYISSYFIFLFHFIFTLYMYWQTTK